MPPPSGLPPSPGCSVRKEHSFFLTPAAITDKSGQKVKFPAEFPLSTDMLHHRPVPRSILEILPLKNRHSLSVSTGRSALSLALDSLPQEDITGKAWLPAICCSSVAAPFLARGYTLLFYGDPGRDGLPPLARGDVFLYIHFCGFPSRAAEKLLSDLPGNRYPFVVEDCVSALFTANVGEFGDFVLYSFRKFLAVPDGGLLLSRSPLKTALEPAREPFIAAKTLGSLLNSPELLRRGEDLLDTDHAPREPSDLGRYILDRLPWEHIPGARRKNYAILASLIPGALPLDEDTVPLGLPLFLPKGKAELERRLRGAGFDPPFSWDAPPGDPKKEAERVVVLPCDERMEEEDLEKMAELCLPFLS